MFGDNNLYEDIAEELLELYELDDLLELNNLTELETVAILLEGGYIGYPRNIIDRLQSEEVDDS